MTLKSMADISPIKKLNLGEEAAAQIRRLIINGKLGPGTKMVERDICQLLDISRTPIRDALKTLEQQGFIKPVGKSLVVCDLSVDEADQFYRLINNLEQFLIGDITPMAKSTQAMLGKINQALITPDNDIEQTIELDIDFHSTLLSHHNNQKAFDIYLHMRSLAARYDFLFFAANPNLNPSGEEHQQMIRYAAQGDAKSCQKILQQHWIDTLPGMLEVVAAANQSG